MTQAPMNTFRRIRISGVLSLVILLLFTCPNAYSDPDPGIPDTLRVGNVSGDAGCPIGLPVTIITDDTLTGGTVSLRWGTSDIFLDSISYNGSVFDTIPTFASADSIDNSLNHEVLVGFFFPTSQDSLYPTAALWFTLWFTANPAAAAQTIVFDTSKISPGVGLDLIFSSTVNLGHDPQFSSGGITLTTPFADADGDGIGDACDICPNDPDNDIDGDGICGDVDNCATTANPGQDDADLDNVGDVCDNCPDAANTNQSDIDSDLFGDVCDNCPATPNFTQADADSDGAGDHCDVCPEDSDDDADGDGLCADVDNCPGISNAGQADSDGDGIGDDCDNCPNDPINDVDGDGICADVDNCPFVSNGAQIDSDGDGVGDICDNCPNDPLNDFDSDGICGDIDNCPTISNASQTDTDGDTFGDVCDGCPTDPFNDPQNDSDGDGFGDQCDNCPAVSNASQIDSDGDGLGDACDTCPNDSSNDIDGDGVCADVDNCSETPNAGQLDTDGDGIGDACDSCPNDPDNDIDNDGLCGDVDPCPLDEFNDEDGDGLCANVDNCPKIPNAAQTDLDGDGVGTPCDNCPNIPNPDQEDSDLSPDGLGDACFLPQNLWPIQFNANAVFSSPPSLDGSGAVDALVNLMIIDAAGDTIGADADGNIINTISATGARYLNINGSDLIVIDTPRSGDYDIIVVASTPPNPSGAGSRGPQIGEKYSLSVRTDGTVEQSIIKTTSVPDPGTTNNLMFTAASYAFGDANGDTKVNISDITFLIARIFAGGNAPNPIEAGDPNCDEKVNIADITFLISRIFAGGPAPGCP